MLKVASKCVETNQMIGRIWFEVMQRRIGLYLLRVQSKVNIAYLPSRKHCKLLEIMGAQEIEENLRMWLEHLWEVLEFTDFGSFYMCS